MRIYFIALLHCLLLLSCNTKKQEEKQTMQNLIEINKPINPNIEDLIISYDTIRIEASHKSLLSSIQQIRIMNDKFYITDRTEAFVFIFDKSGKYIGKICNQGEGPEEYLKISKFEIDPYNNRILLTDNFSRKLFEYDENGKLLTIIKTKFFPLHFASDKSRRLIHLNSGPTLYDINKNTLSDTNCILFINDKGEITNSILKDETPNKIDVIYSTAPSYTDKGELLYMPVLSDIIYKIGKDNVFPEYRLTSKCKNILSPKEKGNIHLTFDNNNIVDYEKKGNLISFGSFLKSDSMMILGFGWKNKWRTFYSNKLKKSFTIVPDALEGNVGLREIFSIFPQVIENDICYIVVDPILIEYTLPLLPDGKLKTFFESFTEEDNPCIIAYRINKKLFDAEG